MQIFIRTVEGRSVTINEVELTTTVETLKQKAQEKTGVPLDMMRLVYGGKPLRDDRDLGSYNIEKDSNVDMLFRLVGGSTKLCSTCSQWKESMFNFPKCTAACSHTSNVCVSCLQQQVRTAVTWNISNIRCKTCSLVLEGNDVRRHAPNSAVFEAWEQQAFNAFLTSLEDVNKCPKCNCRIEKTGGCNAMKCPHCKGEFCWLCLEQWPLDSSGCSVPTHKQTCRFYSSTSKALF